MKKLLVVCLCLQVLLTGCQSVSSISWNEDDIKSTSKKWKFWETDETEIMGDLEAVDSEQGDIEGVDSSHEFVFKETYKAVSDLTNSSDTITIRLYLGDYKYYPIEFPSDVEYVSDNSKYIYAVDGSVSISVLSNVSQDQLSAFSFVGEAESVTKNLIVTEESSTSDKKEAAIYLGDGNAIVVRTYNNPAVFDTVTKGMMITQAPLVKTTELNVGSASHDMPNISRENYHTSVTAGLGDEIQKIYTYDSGTLTVSRELRKFETAIQTLSVRLSVVTECDNADIYYNDGEVCFVQVGDYFAAAYSVNYNTTLTCFGSGNEARFNAIKFIDSQK